MKLKNNALQELYDRLVDGPISLSVYAGVLEKPFEEVDRELTNIQNRNDVLEKSNGTLLDANLNLCSKNRDLNNRIKQLEKDHESDVRVIGKLHSQMVTLENEKTEQEKRADILKTQKDELIDKAAQLQQEIAELKKQLDGALEAKKAINNSRYKWAQKWLSTKQNLETKLNEAEVKYRRLEKEHEKVTSDYQELSIKLKRIQIDVGRESRHLWDMLQNVNDTQPNEFDAECESMHDIIGMDLEDFLDTYKEWQEQKEIDRMRDYLTRFCKGRLCSKCPLHTDNFKCEGVLGFNNIPDEELERYYETARGCGRYTLKDAKLFATTVEGVNRAITKACEGFCEAVRDADIKITENVRRNSWECTLEAKVEVDKDLLNEVCGIVPVEEEHNFEYGDAVRLPWRDYDYMYIGPYDESKTLVRMFDPKMHAMVTSHIGNVRYNGGKIIICDEDDLRKIWKYKK